MTQRSLLAARLSEIESHQEQNSIDIGTVLGNIDRIWAPLLKLDQAWESVPVEFQRRFQQLMLPQGYVFGSVGTAQRGRLLSFFRGSNSSKSSLVPQMGQSWNQLSAEIEAFAAIFESPSIRNSANY